MKHVLVTGAGGFVGRRLCERLVQEGITVDALGRWQRSGPWQRLFVVDLASESPPPEAFHGVDTVFHLAGHAHAEDAPHAGERHRNTSVDGTRRILAAAGAGVQRIVYASSVKAMGESTPVQGVDESAPCRPEGAYGESRLAAERVLLEAAQPVPLATVLRLPLVYGPGVTGNLRALMRAVRRRVIPRWPAGGGRRSMVHVDDVARAAMLVAGNPGAAGAVYLLSDGDGYTTREVVDLMYAALGTRPPLPGLPGLGLALAGIARGGDVLRALGARRVPFDSQRLDKLSAPALYHATRIRDELGFVPEHTLGEALPEMFQALEQASR